MYIRRHTGIYCRSVTLCNCGSWPSSMYRSVIFPFDVGDCGHSRQGREDFVSMPLYKKNDGTYQNICNPITKEAYAEFNTAIKNAYQSALETEAANHKGFEHRSASVEDARYANINQKARDLQTVDDYLKNLDDEYDM